MLLLAYLMTRTDDWEGSRIRLLGICCTADSATVELLTSQLRELEQEAEVTESYSSTQ
jgi:hypothetical protein